MNYMKYLQTFPELSKPQTSYKAKRGDWGEPREIWDHSNQQSSQTKLELGHDHCLSSTLLLSQPKCCFSLVAGRNNPKNSSWPVSLWPNCRAVSQRSVSVPQVKISQWLNHEQASGRMCSRFCCPIVLSAGCSWPGLGFLRLTTAPCTSGVRQLINNHLHTEQSIPAKCSCSSLRPCQQLCKLSFCLPRRPNQSLGICCCPGCN